MSVFAELATRTVLEEILEVLKQILTILETRKNGN